MIGKLCVGSVLDVGCNCCELKKYLTDSHTYTGIDIAPLDIGIFGDVYAIPFPDKSFDTVALLETLEHLERPLDALKEIHRVVKIKVIISVPNPFNLDQIASVLHNGYSCKDPDHLSMFSDNEIYNLCIAAGFTRIIPVRFYTKIPGLNWLVPIKSCFGEWSIYEVFS